MIGCERRGRYGKPAKSSALTHIWEVLRLVISINFLPKKKQKKLQPHWSLLPESTS